MKERAGEEGTSGNIARDNIVKKMLIIFSPGFTFGGY